jgi:hypothetical protein
LGDLVVLDRRQTHGIDVECMDDLSGRNLGRGIDHVTRSLYGGDAQRIT